MRWKYGHARFHVLSRNFLQKHFFSLESYNIYKKKLLAQVSWAENTWCMWWWRSSTRPLIHDDVIKWKHFTGHLLGGIHRSSVNSPHKGQWRGALIFSLIRVWINGWVNNREAFDLRRYRAHNDVNVMFNALFLSSVALAVHQCRCF